jgi:transcriptional regulator with XRE-family HTH domain
MHKYVEILASNVKALLEKTDRKPAWLAKRSGVAPSQISRILEAKGNPSIETIAKIAGAFELSVMEMLRPDALPNIQPTWNNIEALEQDARTLVSNYSMVTAQIANEIVPSNLSVLFDSKHLLEEEINNIQSRVKFLREQQAEKNRRASKKPEASPNSELQNLTESENTLVAAFRKSGPLSRAAALGYLTKDPKDIQRAIDLAHELAAAHGLPEVADKLEAFLKGL